MFYLGNPDPNPQMRRRIIFRLEQYDGEWPPAALADCIAWLQDKLDSIPEEYRGSAEIDIDSVSGYEGSHYAEVEITYSSPETEEEVRERIESYAENKRRSEDAERAQYAALKAKFGG